MIVTVLLTNYIVCFWLIIYQTRVSHDLIITDNSYRSCLILIYISCWCCVHYTSCWCCVHASCRETAKGLAISSSPQNYVRGPVQGFGFLCFTHFRAWKAKACWHIRWLVRTFSTPLYKVWMSRREDPCGIFNMLFIETAIHFFSFLLSLLIFFSACWNLFILFLKGLHQKAFAKNI